ncbi:MAG: hypothetical protein A2622_08720 [Bdellovibrionales bacterium RIFCSPHIGHO2_01_FULL_40_29]|nr:MAG: hypothetical protein A2622_08720 [Bdellovibrionales bacterium RIFCSPHIGHO2_01_FULL_40_29]OFZ32823.1 MAG: hypothetical protein A3D17_08930 [Bdellovibrionales bacterium RIFCSPHIGHO2_02_FULL_40_15]
MSDNYKGSEFIQHDPTDPNPWYALYLDQSTPIRPSVKEKWLKDCSSHSRQYLLPFARPFAKLCIIIIQILKVLSPIDWRASKTLHRLIVWGLKTFVRADANELILRHFHVGSEILGFIANNVPGVKIPMNPLRPRNLDDLKNDLFLTHDLNLYNFVINLNKELRNKNIKIKPVAHPDFSMITAGEFDIEPQKNGFFNFIDLETAISLYTPIFQFFLTDNDFWRATNSLQLDETIGIYAATILSSQQHLVLVNNKHPLVSLITLNSSFRLVLHGLSSEMGHWLLVQKKLEQQTQLESHG